MLPSATIFAAKAPCRGICIQKLIVAKLTKIPPRFDEDKRIVPMLSQLNPVRILTEWDSCIRRDLKRPSPSSSELDIRCVAQAFCLASRCMDFSSRAQQNHFSLSSERLRSLSWHAGGGGLEIGIQKQQQQKIFSSVDS